MPLGGDQRLHSVYAYTLQVCRWSQRWFQCARIMALMLETERQESMSIT